MRNFLFTALLLAFITPAFALDVKFERGTVSNGDTVKKMLKIAGKPHAIFPASGLPGFQVYEYLTADKNIRFTVKDGKIVGIGIGSR
jgi:hypothetical protein